jgi:hypothetical protein
LLVYLCLGPTVITKAMRPQVTVNSVCRPSLLKEPPVSNRMKADTNSAAMRYSNAQCTWMSCNP